MGAEGGVHDPLALLSDEGGCPLMYTGRGEQVQAGMIMFVVIPIEEAACPRPGGLNVAKVGRISGVIFERFELGLRKGVII